MLAKSRVTGIEPEIPVRLTLTPAEHVGRRWAQLTSFTGVVGSLAVNRLGRLVSGAVRVVLGGVSTRLVVEGIAAHVRVSLEGWSQHMSD
jgi:hypothetical protein